MEKFVSVAAMIPFVIQVIVCVGYVATALFVDGLTVANASLPKNDCFSPSQERLHSNQKSIGSSPQLLALVQLLPFSHMG